MKHYNSKTVFTSSTFYRSIPDKMKIIKIKIIYLIFRYKFIGVILFLHIKPFTIMIKSAIRFVFTIVILMAGITRGISQTAIPDVLEKGTLPDQMNYLEEKTRIYENYRAIREDIFQLAKKNAVDSLAKAKNKIVELAGIRRNLNIRIDSLNNSLGKTKDQLEEMTSTKNSIRVIGIEMNKIAYNSLMWTVIAILLFLLGVGFLAFKRNRVVTIETKKELAELKSEFETYRTKTRLEREKMSMDHFNEIKRLKGR
jgi:hypothetical protein